MNADDRERMMRMRAVPDDFDNVQALHSPYGATNHGLSTPMQSPVDYTQPNYGDPTMMRPMMTVDTMRRQHSNEHLSNTGLSPAFGMVGFSQGPIGSMSSPDVLSPLSMNAGDRFYSYPSPTSSGPRTANPFATRQNSIDNSYQMQQRPPPQRIMPLQIRDSMSRARSESLQTPLRSSMSWTGDSLDYANYQPAGAASSPGMPNSQQQRSSYHPEQPRSHPPTGNPFDANSHSSKFGLFFFVRLSSTSSFNKTLTVKQAPVFRPLRSPILPHRLRQIRTRCLGYAQTVLRHFLRVWT